jgi:hypothetical protein
MITTLHCSLATELITDAVRYTQISMIRIRLFGSKSFVEESKQSSSKPAGQLLQRVVVSAALRRPSHLALGWLNSKALPRQRPQA